MNTKDRIIISDTWGGAVHRLQVSENVIQVAIKEAVKEGLLPEYVPLNDHPGGYIATWLKMQRVLEVAIQKAVDEGEWQEEVQ